MKFHFEVLVSLKAGLLDPQGKAIEDALPTMGWTNVHGVRVGKHVELNVEAVDEGSARKQVEDMAVRLLSNPVIEDFRILGETRGGSSPRVDPSQESTASGPDQRMEVQGA